MNDIPPNIKPLTSILRPSNWWDREEHYSLLVCPECGFNYTHLGEPRNINGNDSYDAWKGRGDCLLIPAWSECGSDWEILFGFHKGETQVFVRVKKSCSTDSFLYFIEAIGAGFIKIGRSGNPEQRLAHLSTASPHKLRLIGKISGGSAAETELHKRFEHLRMNGEWFKDDGALRSFIREATA